VRVCACVCVCTCVRARVCVCVVSEVIKSDDTENTGYVNLLKWTY